MFQVDKIPSDVFRKTFFFIREKYGETTGVKNIWRSEDNKFWIIPLHANLSRVLKDEYDERTKVRYLHFDMVGKIKINTENGKIAEFTKRTDLISQIDKKLSELRNSVEIALRNKAAYNFAKITYSEYMFSKLIKNLRNSTKDKIF